MIKIKISKIFLLYHLRKSNEICDIKLDVDKQGLLIGVSW